MARDARGEAGAARLAAVPKVGAAVLEPISEALSMVSAFSIGASTLGKFSAAPLPSTAAAVAPDSSSVHVL